MMKQRIYSENILDTKKFEKGQMIIYSNRIFNVLERSTHYLLFKLIASFTLFISEWPKQNTTMDEIRLFLSMNNSRVTFSFSLISCYACSWQWNSRKDLSNPNIQTQRSVQRLFIRWCEYMRWVCTKVSS